MWNPLTPAVEPIYTNPENLWKNIIEDFGKAYGIGTAKQTNFPFLDKNQTEHQYHKWQDTGNCLFDNSFYNLNLTEMTKKEADNCLKQILRYIAQYKNTLSTPNIYHQFKAEFQRIIEIHQTQTVAQLQEEFRAFAHEQHFPKETLDLIGPAYLSNADLLLLTENDKLQYQGLLQRLLSSPTKIIGSHNRDRELLKQECHHLLQQLSNIVQKNCFFISLGFIKRFIEIVPEQQRERIHNVNRFNMLTAPIREHYIELNLSQQQSLTTQASELAKHILKISEDYFSHAARNSSRLGELDEQLFDRLIKSLNTFLDHVLIIDPTILYMHLSRLLHRTFTPPNLGMILRLPEPQQQKYYAIYRQIVKYVFENVPLNATPPALSEQHISKITEKLNPDFAVLESILQTEATRVTNSHPITPQRPPITSYDTETTESVSVSSPPIEAVQTTTEPAVEKKRDTRKEEEKTPGTAPLPTSGFGLGPLVKTVQSPDTLKAISAGSTVISKNKPETLETTTLSIHPIEQAKEKREKHKTNETELPPHITPKKSPYSFWFIWVLIGALLAVTFVAVLKWLKKPQATPKTSPLKIPRVTRVLTTPSPTLSPLSNVLTQPSADPLFWLKNAARNSAHQIEQQKQTGTFPFTL